jgi:hypothetical protein
VNFWQSPVRSAVSLRPPLRDVGLLRQDEGDRLLAARRLVAIGHFAAERHDVARQALGFHDAGPRDLAEELVGEGGRAPEGAGGERLKLIGLRGIERDRRSLPRHGSGLDGERHGFVLSFRSRA